MSALLQVAKEKKARKEDSVVTMIDANLKYAALDKPYHHVEFLCEYLTSDFLKHFVILPRNVKSRGARLASYGGKLRDKMALILEGNKQIGSLDDVVIQSNLYPDHTGWLVDQSSGRRRWCIIADMLLCVFENKTSERPVKVIMLPGHKVKAMVFASAKQDVLTKAICTYEERSEEQSLTISGVQKHQFAIYSPDSGERFMFGADTKDIIDKWVAMVTVATNLSQDLFTDSDEDSNTDSGYIPSSFSQNNTHSHSEDSSRSGEPRRGHCSSESMSGSNLQTNSTELILSTRTPSSSSSTRNRSSDSNSESDGDKLAFAKVKRTTSFGSHNDLSTNDKKKLKSGRLSRNDCRQIETSKKKMARAHSWSMGSQESLCSSVSQTSVSSAESKQSVEGVSRFKALWARNTVKTIDLNGKDNPDLCEHSAASLSRSAVTRSLEERIKSIPLPASIANALLTRRASADSIRVDENQKRKSRSKSPTESSRARVFTTKNRKVQENFHWGSHGKDDIKATGWLQYKQLLKWTRMFCVISKSYFYGYRSNYPSETPDLVLPLWECSVQLVENEKQRKHCFKICHLNAKITYLAASDSNELIKWLSAMKEEAKAWENPRSILKPQACMDSLISRSSLDSTASRNSFDSKCSSNLSGGSLYSSSYLRENHRTAYTNSNNDLEENGDVDIKDGFASVISEKKGKTSKWHPPCPAHGLDSCTSSLHSSGILYESAMRRNASFSNSMSSCDCSLDLTDSHSDQEPPTNIELPNHESTGPEDPSVIESDGASVASSCSCVCSSVSECVCGENNCYGFPQLGKFTSSPAKCDTNLKQVWKNDTNYQLQLLKSRVSALPDKPEIFNIHLPGPNNEGLLLVSDESIEPNHCVLQHGKTETHRICPTERSGPVIQRCVSDVVVAIPAREVSNPTLSGYLDRKQQDGTWKCCWFVLKDSTLYRYNAPIDDMTENVVQLPGYTVTRSKAEPNTQFILILEHQDFGSETLRTESEAECSSWKQKLEEATHKHFLTTDQNDNTETISDASSEGSHEDLYKEIVQVKKEELLREVLQQKQDIEKKRAHRTSQIESASKRNSVISTDSLPVHETDSLGSMQSENVFKQLTYLKQRKFSTQLKVQSLQKQLQQLQEKRKEQQRGFKFGRRVKSESKTSLFEIHEKKHSNEIMPCSTEENHIQHQLQNLTSELHVLDEHLDKMQRSATVSIGLTTPELLTSLEKRRQLSKKISTSQKSSDGSSIEGDRANDSAQSMERTISKSSGLKLHKPHISKFLFKKTATEKKTSKESSQGCDKCEESNLSSDRSSDSNRRLSWERPWRNSWDPTKYSAMNFNDESITKSTSTLHENKQNRMFSQSPDMKWKSKSYRVLPTSLEGNGTKTIDIRSDSDKDLCKAEQRGSSNGSHLRENLQSARNEINPAALAEIAAFEELIREKMGTS